MGQYYNRKGESIELLEWGKLCNDMKYKRVAETTLPDGKWISTVWLGLNHGYSNVPLIFETMVFPNHENLSELYYERYTCEWEAVVGHTKIVNMIKNGEIK